MPDCFSSVFIKKKNLDKLQPIQAINNFGVEGDICGSKMFKICSVNFYVDISNRFVSVAIQIYTCAIWSLNYNNELLPW